MNYLMHLPYIIIKKNIVGVNSTIVLYSTIENNTKYIEQKIKISYIENNYYLLYLHAVFMGMTTASPNDDGSDAALQSDGV